MYHSSPLPVFRIVLLFALSVAATAVPAQRLTTARTSEGVQVLEEASPVLFYQAKPKSLNGQYERADYIHPLYSLEGNVLTEDFPKDHLHQRGIYWAWHQIIYNNKQLADGWTCENISWEVTDTKIRKKRKAVTLDNTVLWKSALEEGKPTPIIEEHSSITVHGVDDGYRLIDFDIQLTPLLDHLKIGGSTDEKGYSGFSLRLKLPEDIRFLTQGGEVKARLLSVPAGPWMDFVGSFEGKNKPQSGVAVFSHASNPGYPEPWIIRDEKSMQNPAFPGREAVELPAAGWRLRYRVVVHSDKVGVDQLEKLFQQYNQGNP